MTKSCHDKIREMMRQSETHMTYDDDKNNLRCPLTLSINTIPFSPTPNHTSSGSFNAFLPDPVNACNVGAVSPHFFSLRSQSLGRASTA